MADDRIEIELILEDGSTTKAFLNVEKKATKAAKKVGSSFGNTLKNLRGPIIALGSLFAGIFAGRAAIRSAAEAEQSIRSLSSSLKTAGTFSIETRDNILALGDSFERVTTTSSEQFQSLVGLAQSYTDSAEAATELAKASLDFAAGADLTVTEAVRRLGRGVQGATGDIANFVPEIRNLTREQLRAGVATELLGKRFAGAAQEEAKTFTGSLVILGAALGGVPEALGAIVTSSPALQAVFKFLGEQADAVSKSIEAFAASGDILGQFLSTLIKFAQGVNTFVVAPIEFTFNAIKVVFDALKLGLQAFVGTFAGLASSIAGFFAPDSEIAQNLKTFKESADATFVGFAEDTAKSLDSVFNFETATGVGEFLGELNFRIDETLGKTNELVDEGLGNINKFGDGLGKVAKKAEFDLKTRIGQGISSSIQATIGALQRGENAFEAFGKAVLGIFGDLAIQLGQFFIIQGIAVESLKSISGAGAIAAGIALVALGTLLKGAAGGGAPAVGAAPGSAADTGGVAPGDTLATEDADTEELREPKTIVNIRIDGVISDPTGVAQQLNELLNDFADTNGGAIVNVV